MGMGLLARPAHAIISIVFLVYIILLYCNCILYYVYGPLCICNVSCESEIKFIYIYVYIFYILPNSNH